jgi:peptidoglycan/LPS O-acetylase OafA/YrhL
MQFTLKQHFKGFREKLFAEITSVPEVLQSSYLPGLDGLRAISIIIVLLGHFLIGTQWVNYFPGVIGVDIFFVISGFLITTLLIKEKIKYGKVSLNRFYIRRFLRIFPVAYLYLLCLLILNYIFDLHSTLKMFLTAGLYIGNFPIQYGSNWQTSHFWSLAVEEQFYLLFPFILVRSTNRYMFLIVLILILLPFIVIAGGLPLSNHILHKFILSFTYLLGYGTASILIGSITSILLFKRMIILKGNSPYFLSFIIFVMAIGLHVKGVLNWNIIIYIFPLLISYVIVLNLTKNSFFSSILNHPILIKIGVLSYSIYIWQQLFSYDQPWKGFFRYSDSLLLNSVALFFVAYLSYTFYESKFLKLKRHFKNV